MSLRVYWLNCSMSIFLFQWHCFNLVDTCNIALILFLKCDVTKFRIPPCHTMLHFVDPVYPLKVWRNLWMAPYWRALDPQGSISHGVRHITLKTFFTWEYQPSQKQRKLTPAWTSPSRGYFWLSEWLDSIASRWIETCAVMSRQGYH